MEEVVSFAHLKLYFYRLFFSYNASKGEISKQVTTKKT